MSLKVLIFLCLQVLFVFGAKPPTRKECKGSFYKVYYQEQLKKCENDTKLFKKQSQKIVEALLNQVEALSNENAYLKTRIVDFLALQLNRPKKGLLMDDFNELISELEKKGTQKAAKL